MKNWLKIFVAIVILTVCVVCFGSGRAEAAVDYTTYDSVLSQLRDYYLNQYGSGALDDKPYYLFVRNSHPDINTFHFIPSSEPLVLSSRYDTKYGYCTLIKGINNGVSFIQSNGSFWYGYLADYNIIPHENAGVYYSNYVPDYIGEPGVECYSHFGLAPVNDSYFSNNLFHSISTVSLFVDGKDVTITEPYEYYFVSYAYDKVRLIFSDEPLTADYVSLDKLELYSGEQTTVCYTWDEDNPDFLASRMVFDYAWTITHSLSSDYASNYDVLNSRTGYTVLNTKLLHPVVEDLFSTLPDELLLGYDYYIVLRQDSPFAYTHDVVFYGWNDVNADLIIRWGDSNIRAARKGKVVDDQVMARYNPDTKTWVIDSDTPISICTNETYNVPYIYYCNSHLFIQSPNQNGWYTNRLTAYMPDLEIPNLGFDVPELDDDDITGIEWLDDLLKGLGSLLSRLFIPSASYIQKKIDVLTSRFTFWRSVADTVYVFFNFLRDTDFT